MVVKMPFSSDSYQCKEIDFDIEEAYCCAEWEALLDPCRSNDALSHENQHLQNPNSLAQAEPPQRRPSPRDIDNLLNLKLSAARVRFESCMTPSILGRKKDDLLHGLVRIMKKLAQFCSKADSDGFDRVFRALVSDHKCLERGKEQSECDNRRKRRGKYVPMRACLETRPQYFRLFQGYQSLYPTQDLRCNFTDYLVCAIPKRDFTKTIQGSLFALKETRMFFYHTVTFLDQHSDGLAAALGVCCDSAQLKEQLMYCYMNYLDLKPFDGLSFGNLFSVCKHPS